MPSSILDNSILNDIKKLLGIATNLGDEYTYFDQDLLIHINSCFSQLKQLGVGPTTAFSIADNSATWGDFFSDKQVVEMVRSWMYLKMIFDPPTSSIASEAYKAQISEFEWRMNVDVETSWEESEE